MDTEVVGTYLEGQEWRGKGVYGEGKETYCGIWKKEETEGRGCSNEIAEEWPQRGDVDK